MPNLFISYRRQDSADVTGRLCDHLQTHFGREAVFVDIDSIPYGVDFRKRLEDAVSRCDVLLAVIGDHWLDAAWPEGPRQGKRRLDDPEDYVRGEIGAALDRGIPVVPVLVGRASMPAAADLPDGLKEFAYRNAAPVRSGPDFGSQLDRLIRDLEWLADKRRQLREDVQKAIDLVDQDPEMALVRGRKVLELVVREMYERRYHEPPGPRPPESLLQRLVNDGYFPSRFGASAAAVCKLGNAGAAPSSQRITAEEVRQTLIPLTEILKWYMEVEQPNAVGRQENQPVRPASHTGQLAGRTTVPVVHERNKAIVPKGPRSFDAKDADFFLDLLPGPRDKDGLPESIRSWKHRIEERDEPTFSVGVIYGPSGCGKSSLVKAGLLPRLPAGVVSVYVEATAADTEARLLKGLRKRLPGLPGDADLTGALAALRQNEGAADGQKVLLVVDQFEQWLHARRQEEDTELARALRQCDGERVQAIVLVRDDFWMALTRFLGGLNIELIQGRNAAAVDLFDPIHARAVLTAFGRAFGRLADVPTKEQAAFLDQAVAGLSQDGRVICVRLALFAEMVKGKPWTPATLKAVGGAEGVGAAFLEETFGPVAGPRNRRHQDAARSVLKALLPERGADIKGHMRSYEELLEASGYGRRPTDFEELVRILDGEVRLITPTLPPEQDAGAEPPSPAVGKYYQLTHDYLIHSLREWLTRKQRETMRGRAELRLAERSAAWNAEPETRHLPAWWEWLNVRLLTRRRHWTPPQRKMMRRASRRHGEGAVLLALLLVLATGASLALVGRFVNQTYGSDLVEKILDADINRLPDYLKNLERYRQWADPLLRVAYTNADRSGDANRRVNASLALLRLGDAGQADYLYKRYLDAEPSEAAVIIHTLADSGQLESDQQTRVEWLDEVVEKSLDAEDTEDKKERLAKRQANAGVALLRLGRGDKVWPLLKHTPDPRVRSYLINRLSPLGADPGAVVRRLGEEKEVSIRRALLLTLGEFDSDKLPAVERERLMPTIVKLYQEDPDAGVHGAAGWLLHRWNREPDAEVVDGKPIARKTGRGRRWYVNSQGQTLVVFPGPFEFIVGSPRTEEGRGGGAEGLDEAQHTGRIDRTFALAATEVTLAQYRQFRPEYAKNEAEAPTTDCPAPRVSWYEAAAYCNWLSEKEGIPKGQLCYVANAAGEFAEGVRMAPGFPNLDGYRLPTDTEWEYACRAGARTSRYYGESDDLLGEYAWYIGNSHGRSLASVGSLMPNDFGLFDMLGNAAEWCQDPWPDGADAGGVPHGDSEIEAGVNCCRHRILRGGSFNYRPADVRAAYRDGDFPMNRYFYYGLRPARTIR